MGIKEVKVSIGITVNLGDDESIRLDVSLTADMTEQEFGFGEGLELADTARKELAYQLWDMAEAKLSTYGLADMAEDEREAYAREHCPEFRHMLMLHPDAARELLGAVVEGAEFDDKAKLNEMTSEEVDETLREELGDPDEDYSDEDEDGVSPQPTEGEVKPIVGDIPF